MGMFGMIGGSLRAAGRRMLTPEEEAMAQQEQQAQPRPMPKSPMGAMGAMGGMSMPRPLIGGQMVRPQMQQQQPQKPPSMWDGIAQDPLAFLLTGAEGVQSRQEAQAKAAAQQAEEQRMMEMAQAAGLGPREMLAMQLNPAEYGKSVSTMYGANAPRPSALNLGGGAVAQFDPMAQGDSRLTMLRNSAPPPEKPPWVGAVKGPNNQWDWDPNYIKGYRQLHPDNGSTAAGHKLRPATPEEAQRYGPPGTMGQIDDATGRFYPTSRPNPQTGGMPTENERKFALYAQSAKNALTDIDALEFGGDYADGAKPQWERGNQMNPFDEKARKYDQAIDRFLDGWARAMTGAAMTKEEKEFYYGIMKPTFGDSEAVRIQKAQSRHKMAQNLEVAAARGMNAYNQQGPSGPQADPTEDGFIDGLFPEDGADQVPDGVDPQDWQYMTPEERALFQ